MMILVIVALFVKCKSKSAQYRYLFRHRRELVRLLGMKGFPSRTTYFDRYQTRYVITDRGYDNGAFDDAIAGSGGAPGTRRRFVCQQNRRAGSAPRASDPLGPPAP